jgi:FtsH-binding integral membrane protein
MSAVEATLHHGGVMNPQRGSSTDRLPPLIYLALVGLVSWMVLAAWGFAGPGYADVALVVVTGFFVIVIGIPFILWRVWRANRTPTEAQQQPTRFEDWAAGQFETWQDSVKGSNAAAEIILPIAAAAVGMTAFAIVFHYAAQHAST